jgi:PBP1b-binding outer membrane lipoprotein LpoB
MTKSIALLLLLVFILAACQPNTGPSTVKPTATVTNQTTGSTSSTDSYPAPGANVASPTSAAGSNSSAYPAPVTGSELSWADATQKILSGSVAQINENTKTLEVTLIMKDGSQAVSKEPNANEVSKIIEQCGTKCSIRFSTQ